METRKDIRRKIAAGEKARRMFEPVWAECDNFFAGQQTLTRLPNGDIIDARRIPQETKTHRRTYNVVTARCVREISTYTALAQSYEVDPAPPINSTPATVGHQSAVAAATAAERLLLDFETSADLTAHKAAMRQKCVLFGEGYLWPILDPTVGRKIGDKHEGMIKLLDLDATQVAWEEGMRYEKSPWMSAECFYTPEEMVALWPQHFNNVKDLTANAKSAGSISGAIMDGGYGTANLCSVHHYFERPIGDNPGKYVVLMDDKELEVGNYPTFGETDHEHWIVRYSYIEPDRRSRGKGFLEDLIDPQRAHSSRINLQEHWIQAGAIPQVNVPEYLANKQNRLRIYPGKVWKTMPGMGGVEYVQAANPPQQLMQAPSDIMNLMDSISNSFDYTRLASSGAAAQTREIVAQQQAAQGERARSFARSDEKLAIRLLLLARKYYTEAREIRYKSKMGQSTSPKFVASKELPGRINVRIRVGQPKNKAQVEATAMTWAQTFPQAVSPQSVMLAIKEGNLDIITEPFEADIRSQERRNAEIFHLDPRVITPVIQSHAQTLAQQMAEAQAEGFTLDVKQISPPPGPWPHAQPEDNYELCLTVLTSWMKTTEFAEMDEANQQVARWLKQEYELQKAAEAQAQQVATAEQAQQQGADNAARQGNLQVMPSQPSLASNTPQQSQVAA